MSVLNLNLENRILTLEFNRPEVRNSLNLELLEALHLELNNAAENPEVSAVVLRGAGDKAFSSGADLSETDFKKIQSAHARYAELLVKLDEYPKPLVACVQGACMGGGLGIALSCNLILADDTAVFGTPEIKVGLYPLMISRILKRHLSPKRCDEIMLLGKTIPAAKALEWELINNVCSSNKLDDVLKEWTAPLAIVSDEVLQFGKKAVKKADGLPYPEAIRELSHALGEMVKLESAQKAMRHFRKQ